MNRALWIAAGLLAAVALVSGISKAFVPEENWPSIMAENGRRTSVAASARASASSSSWQRLA